MLGQCAAYAEGLVRLNPELVLGIHWRLSKPGDDDYDEEALQDDPRYETGEIDIDDESTWPTQRWPEHYFAHDEKYAYDAMGRHPLPYEDWDETTTGEDPDNVEDYGMYEGGYVDSAMEHAQETDVFNRDAYQPGQW